MEETKFIKHALYSIFVGACVSFITIMLQGVIDMLQTIPTDAPGILAAVGKYLSTIRPGKYG